MPGPFTYLSMDTSADVTPITPNDYNKAPLLILWLYITTNWDSVSAAKQADIQQIADSLNTSYDTVDAVISYALQSTSFFQSANAKLDTMFQSLVYSGDPTQHCRTAESIPKLFKAAAATWTATD